MSPDGQGGNARPTSPEAGRAELPSFIFLSSDPATMDLDRAAAFLTSWAYWARWRTRSDVTEQILSAWRITTATDARTGAMVGMARAVSDGVGFAYLADVYVEPSHRGLGIGTAIVEEMIENGPGAAFRWMLHTRDAHALYRKFGFGEPQGHRVMERPHAAER